MPIFCCLWYRSNEQPALKLWLSQLGEASAFLIICERSFWSSARGSSNRRDYSMKVTWPPNCSAAAGTLTYSFVSSSFKVNLVKSFNLKTLLADFDRPICIPFGRLSLKVVAIGWSRKGCFNIVRHGFQPSILKSSPCVLLGRGRRVSIETRKRICDALSIGSLVLIWFPLCIWLLLNASRLLSLKIRKSG